VAKNSHRIETGKIRVDGVEQSDFFFAAGSSGGGGPRAMNIITPPRRLKVIFTSRYSAEIVKRGLALQPGERFIQKPWPPQELLEILRHCLDSEG
jgi:hypothetical protein